MRGRYILTRAGITQKQSSIAFQLPINRIYYPRNSVFGDIMMEMKDGNEKQGGWGQ